jgi:hypothetical protein
MSRHAPCHRKVSGKVWFSPDQGEQSRPGGSPQESLAALEGHNDCAWSVALGRIGGRDVAVSGGLDGTVRLQDVEGALTDAKSLLQHQLILGRGPGAFMELVADGAGGHRIARSSPDVWRHFIAKGWTPDGHMVMAPIEEMMTADALAVALAAARGQ